MRRLARVSVVATVTILSGVAAGAAPLPGGGPVPAHGGSRSHDAAPVLASRPVRTSVPVLLVPGWFDTARDLAALRIHLLGSGWPASHVATLTFEERTGSNRDHAGEVQRAIDSLLVETGADEVDVVAHSMGGLALRWYLVSNPEAPVRRAIFIASPHRGTFSAHLAWGEGRSEMMPDSPFLDTLNARASAPSGVEAITIRTVIDTHIVPGASATLPGVPDYEVCCPSHAGLLHDDEVFDIVRSFLDSGTVVRSPGR